MDIVTNTHKIKMNRRFMFLFFSLSVLFNQVSGQSFKEQFKDLVLKNDFAGQEQLLEKWDKTDSNDPELFIAYFNHFVNKSIKKVLSLDDNPKDKEGFQILEKDSSNKEPVAFLHEDTVYDQNLLKKKL